MTMFLEQRLSKQQQGCRRLKLWAINIAPSNDAVFTAWVLLHSLPEQAFWLTGLLVFLKRT